MAKLYYWLNKRYGKPNTAYRIIGYFRPITMRMILDDKIDALKSISAALLSIAHA